MRDVIFTVVAVLAAITVGLAVTAGHFYVETGQGLHPVNAGVIALMALLAGLWASGEVTE